MQDLLTSFDLHNPFVQHTLFAFASLALGLLGMVLGQRVATQGKLCIVLGVLIGIGTMWLLATPFASLAPGFCGVFVFSFVASNLLMKLACGTTGGSTGTKKPVAAAGSATPPAGPPRS